MIAPQIALLRANVYTFRMSQKAVLEKALGASDDRVRDRTKEWAVGLCDRLRIEVRAQGVEAVDWSAPCVLMANHASYLDVMALYRVLPRCFGFVAKQALFKLPFFGGVMRALGCVAINRESHVDAVASMQEAARIVRTGSTIAVFPEGTRGRGDRIAPLKKGAFHLVQLAQVPSVPVGIRGAAALMPRENTGIRPGVIEVYVGPPIPPPPPDDIDGRTALRLTVRTELGRLAGLPLSVPLSEPRA
jgi:1-acyl-sn-glycerol-3-phosphate acyltransferase